ncbi:MAG: amidohydrolase family protein [Planctomycetes bacterium]|nr:amidohydrolase family protein [Planctomycetota bacterium]
MSAWYLATLLVVGASPSNEDESRSWTVFADKVYTAVGDPLDGGLIRVQDGKIAAIAPGSSAGDGKHSLSVTAVTPGLIDLSARIDGGSMSVEQSEEAIANLRAFDALDRFAEDWTRQAKSGVTCVMASTYDDAVIGGLSVALKTAGADSLAERVVRADVALRAAMGQQPSSRNHPAFGRPNDFYSRRPTTRMGVEWALRDRFFEAAYSKNDESRAFPGSKELLSVLAGERPIAIQAWSTQDIRTAIFWKEEMEREGFGRPKLILDAAAEAWKEPQLLVRSGTAVVLPPYPAQGRTGEGAFMALDTAKILHERGVTFALSAHNESTPSERLALQPGYAMRGGLSFDAALKSVTIVPARMIGIEKRVGSIEVGKDADLVLWNGKPFEATSRVVGVLVDGRLILDPRAKQQEQGEAK